MDEPAGRFESLSNALQDAGKAQTRYVNLLLGFLAVLWLCELIWPAGNAIAVLGIRIQPSILWSIAPVVLTGLSVALVGAVNVMGPIYRFRTHVWWTDLDANKNLVDYLVYLRPAEGAVNAEGVPQLPRPRSMVVFAYALLLLAACLTILSAVHSRSSISYKLYVYGCAAIQVLFGSSVWYRTLRRFFGRQW